MFINGEWVSGNEQREVVHPYDGQIVDSVSVANAEQVNQAINAADHAVENSELSAYERYELLSIAADELEDRAEEVTNLITSEQGKPISEARNEVDRAIQTLRLCGEEAKRQFGEYVPMDPQKGFNKSHAFTQREPLGVVGAITPFNFPLMLMVHKAGPALAAGNAVVASPAIKTPLSSLLLFECLETGIRELDAQPGLINVVNGESVVGDEFVSHEAVKAISFTGSTNVGKHLARNAGMRKTTLELGGNDPTIVWHDTNIDKSAKKIIKGGCSNAGQVCNSVERVLACEEIETELVRALTDAAADLVIGDPFDEDTDVAAIIDDNQFNRVVDIFESTVDAGATIEYGGEYGGELGNRVFKPTILSGVTPDMPAATEEIFGPIIPVITVTDFEDAIEQANNTNYGLEAGVFTQDIDRAKQAADEINAGGVNINNVSGFRTDHMPYGGFKDSGSGKEGIKYAVEHLSRKKLIGFHQGFN